MHYFVLSFSLCPLSVCACDAFNYVFVCQCIVIPNRDFLCSISVNVREFVPTPFGAVVSDKDGICVCSESFVCLHHAWISGFFFSQSNTRCWFSVLSFCKSSSIGRYPLIPSFALFSSFFVWLPGMHSDRVSRFLYSNFFGKSTLPEFDVEGQEYTFY